MLFNGLELYPFKNITSNKQRPKQNEKLKKADELLHKTALGFIAKYLSEKFGENVNFYKYNSIL